MSRLMRLQCLGCGKSVHIPAQDATFVRCGACGKRFCPVGTLAPARGPRAPRPEPADHGKRAKAAPPPPRAAFAPFAGPAAHKPVAAAPRRTERTWDRRLAVLVSLVGLVLIGGEVCYLEAGRRRDVEQSANEAVSRSIADAQDLAARGRWNEADDLLNSALATEGATDFGEARPLLEQIRRSRAAALLEAAKRALQDKKTDQVLSLLQAYQADPGAIDELRSQIELATSAEKAAELLSRQPDDQLTAFAAGGRLPAADQVKDGALREVYNLTLRGQLAKEQQRRANIRLAQAEAARRLKEEEARREARIRGTPAVRELQGFMDLTRKGRVGSDPQLFSYLLKELNVTDPGEQAKVLADLTGQGAATKALEKSVAEQRTALKARFRSDPNFDAADQEVFDRIVDRELDALLREGQGA
jgi:hypothetical protein